MSTPSHEFTLRSHYRSPSRKARNEMYTFMHVNHNSHMPKTIICHNCGGPHHYARDCRAEKQTFQRYKNPKYSYSRSAREKERSAKKRVHYHKRGETCVSGGRHSSSSSYYSDSSTTGSRNASPGKQNQSGNG